MRQRQKQAAADARELKGLNLCDHIKAQILRDNVSVGRAGADALSRPSRVTRLLVEK